MRTVPKALLIGVLLSGALTLQALAQSPTGTVAYPKNPSGTPAATDGGGSIATGAPCTVVKCPDKPGAPGHAGDTAGNDQTAGVRTPTAAYPGNPVGTPATTTDGKAPK